MMKKLVLVISFIAGLSVMSNAQIAKRSPEQRAAHLTKVLQKKLKLSLDQATQVNAIFYTQATRMDSLKSNLSTDKKGKHLAARSIMINTEQHIAAVLNDSQKQQFITWVKMQKQHRMEKREALAPKSDS
jgi:hypothetical protein